MKLRASSDRVRTAIISTRSELENRRPPKSRIAGYFLCDELDQIRQRSFVSYFNTICLGALGYQAFRAQTSKSGGQINLSTKRLKS